MQPEAHGAGQVQQEGPQLDAPLLHQLVAYLGQSRTELREEWTRRITDAQLLRAMTSEEIFRS